MLELYHFDNSVCSQKVRLALEEKHLAWEDHPIDILNGAQFEPAYLKLNPRAVVPTLVHDGNVIRESTVICEYLEERLGSIKRLKASSRKAGRSHIAHQSATP